MYLPPPLGSLVLRHPQIRHGRPVPFIAWPVCLSTFPRPSSFPLSPSALAIFFLSFRLVAVSDCISYTPSRLFRPALFHPAPVRLSPLFQARPLAPTHRHGHISVFDTSQPRPRPTHNQQNTTSCRDEVDEEPQHEQDARRHQEAEHRFVPCDALARPLFRNLTASQSPSPAPKPPRLPLLDKAKRPKRRLTTVWYVGISTEPILDPRCC